MVGDGGLNKTEGGKEEGRKGRVTFVQGRCGWRREPEQDGGREGGRKGREGLIQDRCGWQREPEQNRGKKGRRKKEKGGYHLFRTTNTTFVDFLAPLIFVFATYAACRQFQWQFLPKRVA